MKKLQGFTFIEILIALAVFAILATITSTSLYHAFNTRSRLNTQLDQLTQLELALSLIQQDTLQAVSRSVRGNEMRLFPVFIGQSKYLEFTRGGVMNPLSMEQRSNLKRIALICNKNKLIRRTWATLDTVDRSQYHEKILLDNLQSCHFNYLDTTLQSLNEWRTSSNTQKQSTQLYPKAIQVHVTLKGLGEMNLLFIIPGALYESY